MCQEELVEYVVKGSQKTLKLLPENWIIISRRTFGKCGKSFRKDPEASASFCMPVENISIELIAAILC